MWQQVQCSKICKCQYNSNHICAFSPLLADLQSVFSEIWDCFRSTWSVNHLFWSDWSKIRNWDIVTLWHPGALTSIGVKICLTFDSPWFEDVVIFTSVVWNGSADLPASVLCHPARAWEGEATSGSHHDTTTRPTHNTSHTLSSCVLHYRLKYFVLFLEGSL